MSEEQLKAEIERLEEQQKVLQNDWHALRGAIAAYRQVLAAVQAPAVEKAVQAPAVEKAVPVSTSNE